MNEIMVIIIIMIVIIIAIIRKRNKSNSNKLKEPWQRAFDDHDGDNHDNKPSTAPVMIMMAIGMIISYAVANAGRE